MSGGIAAYKACELLRRFTESGHDVTVVPTAAALEFVGAPTWAALSGKPVAHRRLGRRARGAARPDRPEADLVVVAPATADLLAKAAHGLADDLLTNTLLTARCPVVFAPAMHTEMWEHPATQANVATLRARGAARDRARRGPAHRRRHRQGPAARARPRSSQLARRPARPRRGAASAAGPRRPARRGLGRRHPRVPRPGAVPRQPLVRAAGLRAGPHRGRPRRRGHPGRRQRRRCPTRPASRSSGSRPPPSCATPCVAAAADRRRRGDGRRTGRLPAGATSATPRSRRPTTARRPTIDLAQNPDILAELVRTTGPTTGIGRRRVRRRDRRRRRHACSSTRRAKLARKGCDLLVVNDVSGGKVFGATTTRPSSSPPTAERPRVPRGSKAALAHVDLGPGGRAAADRLTPRRDRGTEPSS